MLSPHEPRDRYRPSRGDWHRLTGPAHPTCGGQWHFRQTGYYVQHCGHPTALRPYYCVRPDGSSFYAGDGRAFWKLIDAQRAIVREIIKNSRA